MRLWLEFNDRCLEEARDIENPLFERLNFISITGSNLDEFFMVRVASIHDLVKADYTMPDPSGLKPQEQLERISERVHASVLFVTFIVAMVAPCTSGRVYSSLFALLILSPETAGSMLNV